MTEIVVSTEEELDDLFQTFGNDDILVLFTAPGWCIPCRRFEPHWKEAMNRAREKKMEVWFVKVDMGESPEDTGEHWASKRFDILGVPTIKMWNSGAVEPTDIKARALVPLLKEIDG